MTSPIGVYSFLKNPEKYLNNLSKKYGDPFPFSFPKAKTVWMTGDKELVKKIFTAPADSFIPSEHNPVGPLLGSDGLIMQGGATHLERRKLLTPFFSKKNLIPHEEDIKEIFNAKILKMPNDGTLIIQDLAFELTLKIILKFLFPNISDEQLEEKSHLTEKFLNSYSASFLAMPKWIPGTWQPFLKLKDKVDEEFFTLFTFNLENSHKNVLINLKDREKKEILDYIRTFIVAGHETSATSLSWTLYYILRDENLKKRIIEEISNNVEEKKVLEAAIFEALRIHPPVPFVTRKIVNRPFVLGDKEFEIEDEIGVCISLLHRDANVWENPSEFNADRFLNKNYGPFEYAPFGGGTRKCIGADFSIMEMKIIIECLFKSFDLHLEDNKKYHPEIRQITMGPKKPIKVIYKKLQQVL